MTISNALKLLGLVGIFSLGYFSKYLIHEDCKCNGNGVA